jgi:S1-C subfamily serine protease
MVRSIALAVLIALSAGPNAAQDAGRLVVAIVLDDGSRPLPRHALLISDNPPSSAPRRVRTGTDGTVSLSLPPGSYTIESEAPLAVEGRSYQWMQIVDVAAGRDVRLELTAANAEAFDAATAAPPAPPGMDDQASTLLAAWQDSVVAIWSPTARGTAFLVDARGVLVTNEHTVRSSSSVEVQLAAAVKIPGHVLHADRARDVAILRINPTDAASMRPVPLPCEGPAGASLKERQEVVAIAAPLRFPKRAAAATVAEIEGRTAVADFAIAEGGIGGPVFDVSGRAVGITSLSDANEDGSGGDTHVIRVEEVCATLDAARSRLPGTDVPAGVRLPVEPATAYPTAALASAVQGRTFDAAPYRASSSSFDVTFITPVLLYAAKGRKTADDRTMTGDAIADPRTIDPLDNFGNWAGYVADRPAVLMVRATPRLVEGFWTRIARGAARTQGVSLPPIKRFKPGFSRLQAFCGTGEVVPVHPFKIVQRVTESEAIYEGLYLFEPDALGPACGAVRLVLYGEKEPGETLVVEPALLKRLWDDFEPYRALR